MQESDPLLDALRQVAKPDAFGAVETVVRQGSDDELVRINAVAIADAQGLDEEAIIAAFLHASRLGLFEMSWNIVCPSCGGVLDANATLKTIRQDAYHCAFCSLDREPTLDDAVEVSFTVSPRVRRIGAHHPERLRFWDYYRQIFFGSGVTFPPSPTFGQLARSAMLETIELQAGERMILALQLSAGALSIFDAVTHSAHFIDIEGQATEERQELSLVFNSARQEVGRSALRPGPLRLVLDNRAETRILPGVFVMGKDLDTLIGGRRPYLTAKRLLSNQTFRDLYRTDTLDVDQSLKILSLSFLFTDLKGSTELYERVGDLVAYELVRGHFRVLTEIVASEGGAVVKTIGDALMATFLTPSHAMAAALKMRESMRVRNERHDAEDLILKIGVHEGPCLAVNLNDRQDYFGQTVNIASRVQALASPDTIFTTETVMRNQEAASLIEAKRIVPQPRTSSLRGIAERIGVFELR